MLKGKKKDCDNLTWREAYTTRVVMMAVQMVYYHYQFLTHWQRKKLGSCSQYGFVCAGGDGQ